jgi:hypothetical protein
METDNRCDIVFRKYFSDQRDVHATVCEKGAGGMSQIMEADVRETSLDTSCVK